MAQVNEVRQILMNELGLSRSAVREIVDEIVRTEVEKHVARLFADGHIKRMVDDSVNRLAASNRWDANAVRSLIAEEAGKAVRERVFQSLAA